MAKKELMVGDRVVLDAPHKDWQNHNERLIVVAKDWHNHKITVRNVNKKQQEEFMEGRVRKYSK